MVLQLRIIVLASLWCCGLFLWAQEKSDTAPLPETVQEVIVTAEKREAEVSDVPLSVQVLPNILLTRNSIENIAEASQYVPNLHLSEFSARRTSFPFIRGIGSGLGEPAVVTYIDGVPQLSPSSTNVELLDLERIEVLRGPQGSLYGRNTMGGLIHFISRMPDEVFRLNGNVSFGDHQRQRLQLNSAGVLGGDFFGSISAVKLDRDGFTENILNGSQVDDRDTFAGRAQVVYRPGDHLEIGIQYHGERNRDGGFTLYDLASMRANPHQLAYDFEGETERTISSPSLTVRHQREAISFHVVVSQQDWDATDRSDLDFSPLDFLRRDVREEQQARYAEIRVASNAPVGQSVAFSWQAGITWFDTEFDHASNNELRPTLVQLPISLYESAVYRLDDTGRAIFGQGDIHFSNRWHLGLGLRYLEEDKDAAVLLTSQVVPPPLNRAEQTLNDSFDQLLPRLNLSFQPDDQQLVYASAAKGFRSGGYNRNTSTTGPLTYEEEESWTYELGYKGQWLSNRIALNATLFHINWNDRQLEVPNPILPGRFYLDNVGEAESQGLELDGRALLTESLLLLAGVGLTDAEFTQYIDPFSGQDVQGNTLPIAPGNTWHLGLHLDRTQEDAGGWFANLDVTGVGKIYYDNINTVSQSDFQRVNLRAGLMRWGLTFEAWAKNVFDENYIPLAIPSSFSPSGYVGRPGDPRQVGVTVGYRY